MSNFDRPLITSPRIEVKQSPLHGWGVFAIEDIEADEILDECVFIPCKSWVNNSFLGWKHVEPNLKRYVFSYPKPSRKMIENYPRDKLAELYRVTYPTLVLGTGSIYNTAKSYEEANADWDPDDERQLFIFKSIRPIENGDEICTFYGEMYWDNQL